MSKCCDPCETHIMQISRVGGRVAGGCLVALAVLSAAAGADWPQFRGPANQSVAIESSPPVEWGDGAEAGSKNVAWRTDLPARGVSGPIVVDDKVIVTCASGYKQDRLHVVCFDTASGRTIWERQFWATGRTLCHPTSSVAAPTPASDGERIFAFFSSNDLFCLDLDGNLLWMRALTVEHPTAANDIGMSSSPLVIGNVLVVQLETRGESFASGLDTLTGQTLWRVDRDQEASWTSPTQLASTATHGDAILLQSSARLTAHEPSTGDQIWSYESTCASISSAVAVDGVVYVPSEGLTALRHLPDARASELLWQDIKLGPGSPSPVVHAGRVYSLSNASVLTCADATTGEVLWRSRVKGKFWATPVIAGHLAYCANQEGLMQVVDLTDGTVVGENDMGEEVMGSPAVVGDALYVRGSEHLWKIAQP